MKKKKLRPKTAKTLSDLATAIERKALNDLAKRQSKGKNLTAADYAFIEKMKKAEIERSVREVESKKAGENVVQLRPLSYFQQLAALQNKALIAMAELLDSPSPSARAVAAKALLDKGRKEAPPKSDKIAVRFNPIGESEAETGT